jgi:hypothetical protein
MPRRGEAEKQQMEKTTAGETIAGFAGLAGLTNQGRLGTERCRGRLL